jgi:HEAT repeat protein
MDPLSGLLKNPHKEVVGWAITQHGLYPYNDRALEVLAHYLGSTDPVLRRAAATGLARFFHPRAQALALRHLDDPDPQVRFQLAWGLLKWGSAEALGPLRTQLAREKEPMVRQELALALSAVGPRAGRAR